MWSDTVSPAWTGVSIVMPGAAMISHQTRYVGWPEASTSDSLPAWMSVLSVAMQDVSMQPPPMPTHVDEYSASPDLCCDAAGTTQEADTCVNAVFPGSRMPWL